MNDVKRAVGHDVRSTWPRGPTPYQASLGYAPPGVVADKQRRFLESSLVRADLLTGLEPLWTAVAERSGDTALRQRERDSVPPVPFESAVDAPLCRRTPKPGGRTTVGKPPVPSGPAHGPGSSQRDDPHQQRRFMERILSVL